MKVEDSVTTNNKTSADNSQEFSISLHGPLYRFYVSVADMQELAVRDREIDPKKYYPSDMYREPQRNFPNGFKIDVRQILQKKLREVQAKLTAEQEKIQQLINKFEDQ